MYKYTDAVCQGIDAENLGKTVFLAFSLSRVGQSIAGPLRMNTKQAKDFLVQETAAQAKSENVSLSEIEKRMMYFTESDPSSCHDPLELNDEFEAQYDSDEYEAKISVFLQHAYDRLKAQAPDRWRLWDEAIRELRKGDHYLLVLWRLTPAGESWTRRFSKLLG